MDCLFCNIVTKEIPATITYEDEQVLAFEDINPQAPIHHLIIPRKHIATINDLANEDYSLVGHLYKAAKQIAHQLHIQQIGYRTVMNCNKGAGQEIFHIHLHLLGGRNLQWPPG
ncbi:MAG: histidine triad nucleotide-binding protein [Gammaproteobacteria bacterium]